MKIKYVNIITGKPETGAEIKRKARASAKRLLKAFKKNETK